MDIEKRIRQYLHAYDNGQVDLNEESLAALIHEAVAEVTPPKGHILADDGKVRKVLGSLPITADGCVAGLGGNCVVWSNVTGPVDCGFLTLKLDDDFPDDPPIAGLRTADGVDFDIRVEATYSTREAAEAASKEAK